MGGLPLTYAPSGQQQQRGYPHPGGAQQQQRAVSAAPYGGPGLVRPTSVVTPSEMGDDPQLSAELSRASLMVGAGGKRREGGRGKGAQQNAANGRVGGFFGWVAGAPAGAWGFYLGCGNRGAMVDGCLRERG